MVHIVVIGAKCIEFALVDENGRVFHMHGLARVQVLDAERKQTALHLRAEKASIGHGYTAACRTRTARTPYHQIALLQTGITAPPVPIGLETHHDAGACCHSKVSRKTQRKMHRILWLEGGKQSLRGVLCTALRLDETLRGLWPGGTV